MNKKVLFVATVDSGHILKFHIPYLKYFKEKGYEVHVACSGEAEIPYCDKKIKIPFKRFPASFSNFIAYINLKKVIDLSNYSLIHCHTPVGGVVGRIASIGAQKKGSKILYTAHGFHFYKGSPLLSRLIFFQIEKFLSKYTDYLICINDEDYLCASEKFKSKNIKKVSGVGVDLSIFKPVEQTEKKNLRKKLGFSQTDFIMIYPAELNSNKNQTVLLKAIYLLKRKIPNIKLLLPGDGDLLKQYKNQVKKLGIEENVEFLGFRKDISTLMKISDLAVSSSKREGLPVNIMEAMASGLPVLVSNSRGNRDLIIEGKNGFVIELNDALGFSKAMERLYKSEKMKEKMGEESIKMAENYSLKEILIDMDYIYSEALSQESLY